jgi:hypothetical protein
MFILFFRPNVLAGRGRLWRCSIQEHSEWSQGVYHLLLEHHGCYYSYHHLWQWQGRVHWMSLWWLGSASPPPSGLCGATIYRCPLQLHWWVCVHVHMCVKWYVKQLMKFIVANWTISWNIFTGESCYYDSQCNDHPALTCNRSGAKFCCYGSRGMVTHTVMSGDSSMLYTGCTCTNELFSTDCAASHVPVNNTIIGKCCTLSMVCIGGPVCIMYMFI